MMYVVIVLSVMVLVIAMKMRVLIGKIDDRIAAMRRCMAAIEDASRDAIDAIHRLEQLAGEVITDIEEATSASREAKESAASAFEYSEMAYEYACDNGRILNAIMETVGAIDEKLPSVPVLEDNSDGNDGI